MKNSGFYLKKYQFIILNNLQLAQKIVLIIILRLFILQNSDIILRIH